MSYRILIALFLVGVLAIVVVGLLLAGTADRRDDHIGFSADKERTGSGSSQKRDDFVLSDLRLPFDLADIDELNGEINPIGIVRFSRDQEGTGHSGLDVPLTQGSPIYAVADGRVVNIPSAGDPWGGKGIYQLIQPTVPGEGWAFIYEHVTPAGGIVVGTEVSTGDLIATKTPPRGFTAHFQLSRLFNDYQYTRDNLCWPDSLINSDAITFQSWWDVYRASDHLLNSWRTTDEEGAFPFRGLLDPAQFPAGPQLCYPAGTDVR